MYTAASESGELGCISRCVETRGEYVRIDGKLPDRGQLRMSQQACAVREWTTGRTWKTAVKGTWNTERHINEQELIGVILGVRWLARQPRLCSAGRRVVVLCDSRVAVGALAKGRSSSRKLLPLLRRFSGLVFASRLQVAFVWVPTDCNPADGPSRHVRRPN